MKVNIIQVHFINKNIRNPKQNKILLRRRLQKLRN